MGCEYIDQNISPFEGENNLEPTWSWIEKHAQLCRYSLDLRKCKDRACCQEPQAVDAITLLEENNGFLPPVIKGKDKHYLNPIHILEYADQMKIPSYDQHCPSIAGEFHFRLCCTICGKYFPILSFVTRHRKNEHGRQRRRKTTSPTNIQQLREEPFQNVLSNSAFLDTHLLPYVRASCEELPMNFRAKQSEGEP